MWVMHWCLLVICILSIADGFVVPRFASSIQSLQPKTTRRYGVPGFYAWLTGNYHHIQPTRLKSTLPTQGYSIDNLYLDLNGIIHIATNVYNGRHAHDGYNENGLMEYIFAYTEFVVDTIQPKKLCYISIDGVAPRNKLNQQRSRRYLAAKDRQLQIENGFNHLIGGFDRNLITAGTEFMFRLDQNFMKRIQANQQSRKYWQQCEKVVFSGSW